MFITSELIPEKKIKKDFIYIVLGNMCQFVTFV